MTKEPDNLVLEHLKAIREDTTDLRERQNRVGERLASIASYIAAFQLSQRIERIEKRLELVESK